MFHSEKDRPTRPHGFDCRRCVGRERHGFGRVRRRMPRRSEEAQCTQARDVGHEGVTDTVIAMIDVDKEQGIKDRKFRMRKLTIEPGATVPWHSHGERPAIIYIIEGQIEEYASNCAVPIVHKAGDVVAETKDVSHWWKNLGDTTVVLISADLLKDPNDKNM